MEAALIIFALMMLVVVGLGAYLTVKAVGAAKRGVERTVNQARRTVEDTALKAKSFGQIGTAGALAQLRLDLRASLRATRQALEDGARTDASLRESLGLFERLSEHGHELDEELKRLESEPDKSSLAERLPELRERTERITHAAESLRWAARDRARRFAEDDLTALSAEIEVESGALRDWSSRSNPLDDLTEPRQAPSGTGSSTPGPEAAALPPTAKPAPYPWQKAPRPEATT
ncbi:hypothetical protein [Streptomyces sp. NPDC012888]|uniref:hypothetical protein n=1 Tax=Streptomyces sp. NPDC012888 TaxID=3364855 RepID=UPI0036B3B347